MKQYVTIKQKEKVLYEGRISDIPIKESAIIQKSIELFDDEDPCIIHQSYVIKEYVDDILNIFKRIDTKLLKVQDYQEQLSFLNLDEVEDITISLKE
jgi:hypothetical protein